MDITISKAAKEMIKAQIQEDQSVRIYITGKGWSGPRFALSLDETKENDMIKEIEGITFIIDKNIDRQWDQVKIDYKKGLMKKGFIVTYGGEGGSCN